MDASASDTDPWEIVPELMPFASDQGQQSTPEIGSHAKTRHDLDQTCLVETANGGEADASRTEMPSQSDDSLDGDVPKGNLAGAESSCSLGAATVSSCSDLELDRGVEDGAEEGQENSAPEISDKILETKHVQSQTSSECAETNHECAPPDSPEKYETQCRRESAVEVPLGSEESTSHVDALANSVSSTPRQHNLLKDWVVILIALALLLFLWGCGNLLGVIHRRESLVGFRMETQERKLREIGAKVALSDQLIAELANGARKHTSEAQKLHKKINARDSSVVNLFHSNEQQEKRNLDIKRALSAKDTEVSWLNNATANLGYAMESLEHKVGQQKCECPGRDGAFRSIMSFTVKALSQFQNEIDERDQKISTLTSMLQGYGEKLARVTTILTQHIETTMEPKESIGLKVRKDDKKQSHKTDSSSAMADGFGDKSQEKKRKRKHDAEKKFKKNKSDKRKCQDKQVKKHRRKQEKKARKARFNASETTKSPKQEQRSQISTTIEHTQTKVEKAPAVDLIKTSQWSMDTVDPVTYESVAAWRRAQMRRAHIDLDFSPYFPERKRPEVSIGSSLRTEGRETTYSYYDRKFRVLPARGAIRMKYEQLPFMDSLKSDAIKLESDQIKAHFGQAYDLSKRSVEQKRLESMHMNSWHSTWRSKVEVDDYRYFFRQKSEVASTQSADGKPDAAQKTRKVKVELKFEEQSDVPKADNATHTLAPSRSGSDNSTHTLRRRLPSGGLFQRLLEPKIAHGRSSRLVFRNESGTAKDRVKKASFDCLQKADSLKHCFAYGYQAIPTRQLTKHAVTEVISNRRKKTVATTQGLSHGSVPAEVVSNAQLAGGYPASPRTSSGFPIYPRGFQISVGI